MKFLCVPCDSPMKLQSVGPPERGSLSVVYRALSADTRWRCSPMRMKHKSCSHSA